MIVTDASLQKDHCSGFAWVIAHDKLPLWRGIGLAPGQAEDMHSGHAEAFGMLAALTFLHHYIHSYYDPTMFEETSISCYCDNNGVITTISEMQTSTITCPNDTTNDDRDVFLAIHDIISKCALVSLHFFHVMGHQDSKSN